MLVLKNFDCIIVEVYLEWTSNTYDKTVFFYDFIYLIYKNISWEFSKGSSQLKFNDYPGSIFYKIFFTKNYLF
jgi:hypothetical protein